MIDNKYKRIFCQDYGIPIAVFDEPYFEERIELFDSIYGTGALWDKFKRNVVDNPRYPLPKGYECYYAHANDAVKDIQASEGYSAFKSMSMKGMNYDGSLPQNGVFSKKNNGRYFLSVGMPENRSWFYTLRHYDPSIFDGCETWESFIGRYVDNPCLVDSNTVYNKVSGKCCPSKAQRYGKYMLSSLALDICECCAVLSGREVCLTYKDVTFDVTNVIYDDLSKCIDKINNILSNYNIPLELSVFKVVNIKGFNGCLKRYVGTPDNIDIVNADVADLPRIVRRLRGMAENKNDLVFMSKGKLVKYI